MRFIILLISTMSLLLAGCNAKFDIDDSISDMFTRNGEIGDPIAGGDAVPLPPLVDLGTINGDNEVEIPFENIQKLCATRTHRSVRQNVTFNPPGLTCQWDTDGNLGPANYYFQARIEQKATLDVPPGAILCSMQFSFPNQSFLYDDHFLLTLNRTVLAASYNFLNILEAGTNGLLKYDWLNIRGQVWDTNQETIYCPQIPGSVSSCVFPTSDVEGVIDLDLSTDHIESSMASGVPLEGHHFRMVTIGDNDPLDCEHTGMTFDVEVEYIQ